MATNSLSLRSAFLRSFAAFIFLAALAGVSSLWAQDSGMETRVIRLSWTRDEYALRYEVIVQKEENGVYRNVHREFTQDSSVEIPLPAGNYRCSVIPYDFLNRPGTRSAWSSMEIRASHEPEPLELADLPETETEEPLEADTEENSIADDPPAEKKKTADAYFSIAWMPVVPAHFTAEDRVFNKNPALFGLGTRFGFVSAKQSFLNPGLEVAFSFLRDSIDEQYALDDVSVMTEQYMSKFYSLVFDLNLVMQKHLSNPAFILSFQAGGGITFQYATESYSIRFSDGYEDVIMQDQSTVRCFPQINLGVSLILLPRDHFYLEFGVDYSYLFTQNNPGYLRPRLGLGTRY